MSNNNEPLTDKEYVLQVLSEQRWDSEEAKRAYWWLGRMPKKRLIPLLIEALRDPDEFVRLSACDLLNGFGAKKALPELERLAEEDTDLQVRNHADIAIRHIRGGK